MNRSIEISVIVPIYNKEKYIRKNIESLLSQTKVSLEIILIDDGSTDRSSAICHELSALHKKIVYKKIVNSGVSCARNEGIKLARGEFLIFIDADDYIERDMLESMYFFVKNNGCDFVICGMSEVIQGETLPIANKIDSAFISRGDIFKLDLRVLHSSGNKLFKKQILKEKGVKFLVGLHASEDINFVLKYMYYSESAFFINKCFYNYVRNDDSASASSSGCADIRVAYKKLLENLSAYLEVGDFFRAGNQDVYRCMEYQAKLRREVVRGLVSYQNTYVKDKNASILYFFRTTIRIGLGRLSCREKLYVVLRMVLVILFSKIIRLMLKVKL